MAVTKKASRTPPRPRTAAAKAGGMGDSASVAEYFSRLSPDKRMALDRFRKALKALLPKAEECISYGIPALRHPDGVVVYYAAMKSHLSFFPTSHPIEVCARDLEGYATSRGTIRFPIDEPLPPALVKKLVRVRLEDMARRNSERPVKAEPAAAAKRAAGKAKPLSKINAAWHRAHRMPRNAMPAERAAWHLAHAKACGCRAMPASVAEYLRKGSAPDRKKPG